MAACSSGGRQPQSLHIVLTEFLNKYARELNVEWKKISICKKSRSLKEGDFVIPKGSTPKCLEKDPAQLLDFVKTTLPHLEHTLLPVQKVDFDHFNLVRLHLHRPKAFLNVVQQVGARGDNYGLQEETLSNVVLNPADFLQSPSTVSFLPLHIRYCTVLSHVKQLLKANGYSVQEIPVQFASIQTDSCPWLFLQHLSHGSEPLGQEKTSQSVSVLKQCEYAEHLCGNSNNYDGSGDSKDVVSNDNEVTVNLNRYIQENHIPTGKTGYDKNLGLVNVSTDDGPTHVAVHLTALHEFCADGGKVHPSSHLLHVVSESKAFTQQQVDLLLRITNLCPVISKQSHLVVGSVTGRSGQSCSKTAQEFFDVRLEQMKEASVMKYGDEVTGPAWETTLMRMTAASITFEMLNTACRNNVKLDLSSEDQMGPETRAGAFVMYNCARLSTLAKHFQEGVDKGLYPPLPGVEEVKFENLQDEEEWELLFNYIYPYPDLVCQCVEGLDTSLTDIRAKIHTHKISNFLIHFCRSLSSYYSRVHILGEGKPHLLPVMYARLYLMRAAHQVIKNGLHLLGIEPFSQL